MPTRFQLYPDAASTGATQTDHVFLFVFAVACFFAALIFILVFYFAFKYRRRSEDEVPPEILGSVPLEIFWTAIPLMIVIFIFIWGSVVFVRERAVPPGAQTIYVVGKQWMWKVQHPEGAREINTLHVPEGQPIKLLMTSEDVIHSFYIPAFRIKQDVLPGRYTVQWFQATQPGEYHLYCAEYCGSQHSGMIGSVVVMSPGDYQSWLSGGGGASIGTMASQGAQLFERYGCITCHQMSGRGRGPSVAGVYGRPVAVEGGQSVMADEDYLRESILNPKAKIVAGYPPIMPTYEGQLSEEEILQLISYLKSLGSENVKR